MEVISRKIRVLAKSKLLTPAELITLRNAEIHPIKSGLKKTQPDESEEEKLEIAKFQDELRKMLSVQRIERICSRSLGEWNDKKRAVKIIRKEGKFENFGYSKNQICYLEYFEALFLLELNRLEIYNQGTLMSIEAAYILLLGEEESKKFDNYIVYSTFSRAGYIPQKYNSNCEHKPSDEDCIWEDLLQSLDERYRVPVNIEQSAKYLQVKASLEAIKRKIRNCEQTGTSSETEPSASINFASKLTPTRKRKAKTSWDDIDCSQKKPRHSSNQSSSRSFLNFLKDESEYKQFESVFRNFDIIQLSGSNDCVPDNTRSLEIQFDMFLPNEGFKKSEPTPPTMRIIVLGANEKFPNRSEIRKCCQSQKVQVPLLVATVSESKQIQAFLYHFT